MIVKALDISQEIDKVVSEGITKGYEMMFNCIKDLYSVKLGATSYVVGHEYSGKTEFILERDIWLSKKYGLKHVIFTPETGTAPEIYLEILHKWTGTPSIGKYALEEKERYKYLNVINEYFHVIDVGNNDVTIDQIFDMLSKYEQENKVQINTVTIDPFNELTWNLGALPRDMWLENTLGKIRRKAREENKHITIVTHPIESDRLYHKDGYWLAPTRKQIAGGQAWARKGECIITIWRPPYDSSGKYRDEDGIPYDENEMHFIVQKAKPKGVGMMGRGTLYFDWKRSAYYERWGTDVYYAGEYEQTNNNFNINEETLF